MVISKPGWVIEVNVGTQHVFISFDKQVKMSTGNESSTKA